MGLRITNININYSATPVSAQVGLADQHGCNVFVNIALEGKAPEAFTLRELSELAKAAAKHLVANA